ncbi:MAG: NAD(P)-binding protein, partial [Deltaproteobacteria bacterium]
MKILKDAVIRDRYDVVIVGAGIGGLTAAALLAKKGLKVLTVEQHYLPGGCCTSLRRQDFTFDIAAALLYGFGEKGYSPHRFVMNELEEEIDMIAHDSVLRMNLWGKGITFWRNFERYFAELVAVFPHQKDELRVLYKELFKLCKSISSNENPMPPSEMPLIENLKLFFKNPLSTLRLGYILFKNAESIINKHITDPRLIGFFDNFLITFTCCNISEAPALITAILFTDAHEGGAYYPSGSPQMLPNKLERAIERYGGQILYHHLVEEILIFKGKAYGIRLADGTEIIADRVVSDATIWNLYGKLIKPRHIRPERMKWAQEHVPTFSCLLLYIGVDAEVIPDDTRPIELFVEKLHDSSSSNFYVYIPSLDDPSICPPGTHSLTVIAPARIEWPRPADPDYQSENYYRQKEVEADRVLEKMERYYPNLRKHIRVMEIGTPSTIERFTLKNWGNVGGPKQMMGQEMMKRLKARSEWKNLYICGDSTVLGEGVLPATSSAVGAANMILRDLGLKEYRVRKFPKQYINIVKGMSWTPLPDTTEPITEVSARRIAKECQLCEDPGCTKACPVGIDVLNFTRRIEAGNFAGAVRSMREMNPLAEVCGYICPAERLCEKECNRLEFS